jgi:hypothetical protein
MGKKKYSPLKYQKLYKNGKCVDDKWGNPDFEKDHVKISPELGEALFNGVEVSGWIETAEGFVHVDISPDGYRKNKGKRKKCVK